MAHGPNSTRRAPFRLKPGAGACLEMKNGTSSHSYDNSMAPGCPTRRRELFRREGQVGLRPLSQASMSSYRKSSVAVVCERPRVGLCNGVVVLVLFSFVLLGMVPWGRRQRAVGPWNPPTPGSRRAGALRGSNLRALRLKKAISGGAARWSTCTRTVVFVGVSP